MSAAAFYAKCPECGHVWSVLKMPMEIEQAARLMMAAFCPSCGNDSPTTAPPNEIPTARKETTMSDTTREPGPYTLHKADPYKPRRPHKTYEHAETEAHRLAGLNPGIEYIINREVGRVKVDG